MAERLAKIGITSVADLLFHLPYRYQDRTRITPLRSLRVGEHAVIEGQILGSQIKFGKRRSLLCSVTDTSGGGITLRFFHFNAAQQKMLAIGKTIRCFGEVRFGSSHLEMVHPEFKILDDGGYVAMENKLTPIYPATEGLHQLTLRKLTEQALNLLDKQQLSDYLPSAFLQNFRLPTLTDAVHTLHQPPAQTDISLFEQGKHPAQQRLIIEELLAHQLVLRQLRQRIQQHSAPVLPATNNMQTAFLNNLVFKLTGAQQRVIAEINQDLSRPAPMLRLVQGDVGCGKTVVAALAAVQALENNYQVAIMAPTELLSEQHFNNFNNWFTPLAINTVWLAGKLTGKNKRTVIEQIASGKAQVIVGTHALFQAEVQFNNLALVIIDEQHRFGVHQRLALRDKGARENIRPHQLIMTATPIPRTLAMTAYADLDFSVIDELPPGRQPVQTIAISNSRRQEVLMRVREHGVQKRQTYWVCTLIEESEMLQSQAAEAAFAQLQAQLPELRIGLVHGRIKAQDKETVMREFKLGNIDLLVATTVIEVGVDVPNASLMIIENPERLGLAQLHQLRGRVGRGSQQSHCVLLYQAPLTQHARQRLDIMRKTNDGFVVAQRDLELRGPGEVLGTRQTGLLQFRIADLLRDKHLLPMVQQLAQELIIQHPELVEPIMRRWIGDNQQYGQV